MNKKRSPKLSLHRETLLTLDGSDLHNVAGATAQIGCANTLHFSCRGTCFSCETSCVSCYPACLTTQECA